MKDPAFKLRKAYKALLASLFPTLAVYDGKAADNASGNYIILTDPSTNTDSSKDTFEYQTALTIDIVTRFKGDGVTSKTADDISDAILNELYPSPGVYGLSVDDFRVIVLTVETKDLKAQFGMEYIIRKLLIISHLLAED